MTFDISPPPPPLIAPSFATPSISICIPQISEIVNQYIYTTSIFVKFCVISSDDLQNFINLSFAITSFSRDNLQTCIKDYFAIL